MVQIAPELPLNVSLKDNFIYTCTPKLSQEKKDQFFVPIKPSFFDCFRTSNVVPPRPTSDNKNHGISLGFKLRPLLEYLLELRDPGGVPRVHEPGPEAVGALQGAAEEGGEEAVVRLASPLHQVPVERDNNKRESPSRPDGFFVCSYHLDT